MYPDAHCVICCNRAQVKGFCIDFSAIFKRLKVFKNLILLLSDKFSKLVFWAFIITWQKYIIITPNRNFLGQKQPHRSHNKHFCTTYKGFEKGCM